MTAFCGMPIIVSELVGAYKSVQIAFPKSKKKRIRAKWSKRPANWATTFVPGCYVMDGTLFAHPDKFERLKTVMNASSELDLAPARRPAIAC